MSLYILRPVEGLSDGDNPWNPWYDKCFGFVVRAISESKAREFASEEAGDENRGEFLSQKTSHTKTPWLEKKYSTCIILEVHGVAGVIMEDVASA